MTDQEIAIIEAKREGYVKAMSQYTVSGVTVNALAAEAFPFPKPTRPRVVVTIRDGRCRVVDGRLQFHSKITKSWCINDAMIRTRVDVLKLLDLFDRPTEEVSE